MDEYRCSSFERLQLSVWCNVFGPRVDMLWLIAEKDEQSTYIARHTLNGEESVKPETATEEFKLHVFPNEKIVCLSRLFSAPYQKSKARYSLSATFKSELQWTLTTLFQPIKEFLVLSASLLSKLLHEKGNRVAKYKKVEKVFSFIVPQLDELLTIVHRRKELQDRMVDGLLSYEGSDVDRGTDSHLSESPRSSATHFHSFGATHSHERSDSVDTSSSSEKKERSPTPYTTPITFTPLSLVATESPLIVGEYFAEEQSASPLLFYLKTRFRFMVKAVTSHFQTRCCSVVIGKEKEQVEKFTRMFTVFSPASDTNLTSYFNERYIPNLRIQGIQRTQFSEEDLLLAHNPSTVIDIDNFLVLQMEIFFFYDYRKRFVRKAFELASESATSERLLSKFEKGQCSTTVERMLASATGMKNEKYVNSYIRNHLELFLRKAIVLVNVALHFNFDPRRFRDKKFRSALGIDTKEDYLVYLSFADRLWPGFYMKMAFKSLFVLSQLDLLM